MEKKKFSLGKKIKGFDLFGVGVSFNIDGQGKTKTYIGAWFSIFILCLTIYRT